MNKNRERIHQLLDEVLQGEEQEQAFIQALESQQQNGGDLPQAHQQIETLEAEKDRLFNIVALWLRSPLNSLEMLVKMLLNDFEKLDKATLESFLKHLDKQVGQLQFSMRNLIEWACLEVKNYQFEPAMFNIAATAKSVTEKLNIQAEKKEIQLNNRITEEQLILGDAKMLQLVLLNLVENAIKFSTKNSIVEVLTESTDNVCTIKVKDTGIGMGKAKQKNIFNLARKIQQKGTANENGFGLGLVVSKAILELHNTNLEIESKRGEGTTVSFILPLK